MVYFPQNYGVSVSSVPPFPTLYTTPVLTVVHLLLMFFTTVHSSVQCLMLRSAHTPSVLYRAVSYTAQCLLPRLVLCRAMSNVPQCLMPHIFRRGCRTAGRPWRARTAGGPRTAAAAAEAAQKAAQPPKKGPPFSTFS